MVVAIYLCSVNVANPIAQPVFLEFFPIFGSPFKGAIALKVILIHPIFWHIHFAPRQIVKLCFRNLNSHGPSGVSKK